MKQTAVEWYAAQSMQLEIQRGKGIISISQMLNELSNIFQQAKEMEKNNICDAWDNGYDKGTRDRIEKISNPVGNAEQYYNETFKSE